MKLEEERSHFNSEIKVEKFALNFSTVLIEKFFSLTFCGFLLKISGSGVQSQET